MAETNKNVGGGLANFTLSDNDDDFFGIGASKKSDKKSLNTNLDKIRNGSIFGEEDEDDDGVTPIDKVETKKEELIVEPKSTKPKEDIKDSKEDKPKKEEAKKEEEDVKFFEDDEEEDAPKDKKEDKTKVKDKKEEGAAEPEDKDDKDFYTTLAKELKENNVFSSIELPEGDITYEDFINLQDAEVEARVDEAFEAFFEEMDEDGKEFLKFKKNGGKSSDFIKVIGNGLDIDKFDADNIKQQEAIVEFYLLNDGKDEEEIETQLDYLKTSGKLAKMSEKYFNTIKKVEKENKEKLIKYQEESAKKKEKDIKEFNARIKSVITSTDKVGAFPISKADHKLLTDFITSPTIKVGKNSFIPQFNASLGKILNPKTDADVKKLILLGKLLKNDFDISDVVLTKNTEQTQQVRSALKEARTGIKQIRSSDTKTKSLADYFN